MECFYIFKQTHKDLKLRHRSKRNKIVVYMEPSLIFSRVTDLISHVAPQCTKHCYHLCAFRSLHPSS